MESLKKICVTLVLSMVGYGAYVTLTSKPPVDDSAPVAAESTGKARSSGGLADLPALDPSRTSSAESTTSNPLSVAPAESNSGNLIGSSLPSPDPGVQQVVGAQSSEVGGGLSKADSMVSPSYATPERPLVPVTPPAELASARPAESMNLIAPQALAPPPATAKLDPQSIEAITETPPADAEFDADMRSAQGMLAQGQLAEALLTLSPWFDDPRTPRARRPELVELLDQLAGTVIYSRDHWLEPPYTVAPGDTLDSIAQRYSIPPQLLGHINGIEPGQPVQPGQALKVVRGPFDGTVRLQNLEFALSVRGRYAGRFPVGIGRDVATLEGDYVVRGKQQNPAYYGPQTVIDAADAANPLGEHWIDLGNHVGLHGTNEPQTIGRTEGRGCVRLSERDAQDVYDILSVGSKVTIRR